MVRFDRAALAAFFIACTPSAWAETCKVDSTVPTLVSGSTTPLRCDVNGKLIISSVGAGGTSSNFAAAFPAAGTAIGVKDSTGTNLTFLTADASNNLNVTVVNTPETSAFAAFGSAVPIAGFAAGFSDGTNLRSPRSFDQDSGAGTEHVLGVVLRRSASGGSVELGTFDNPVRVDPKGTTAQPVTQSGTWRTGSEGVFYSGALGSAATYSGTAGTAKAIGGLQTISSIFTANDGSGILTYVSITMNEGQTSPLTVYLFRANPAASTCTDNATFVLNSADRSKVIPVPIVITPQDMTGITESYGIFTTAISVKNGDATDDLYACVVTGSSLTLAAASVVLSVGVSQN
jgi:hypothetical protein